MHRRITRALLYAILLAMAAANGMQADESCCSAPISSGKPAVITIQVKARTSTVEGIDAVVQQIRTQASVTHAVILNNQSADKPASIIFKDLQEPNYDVYVNSSHIGERSREQLEAGLSVELRKAILQQDRPVIQRIAGASDAYIKLLRKYPCPDSGRVIAILANVRSFSTAADGRIRNSGANYIILNPAGKALPSMIWQNRSAEEVTTATANYWKAITDERRILYSKIKNVDLRHIAISTITPVELKTNWKSQDSKVECVLTNQSEVPISGKLVLETPQAVKQPPVARFDAIAGGQVFHATLDLKNLAANAEPDQLKVRAEIRVGEAGFIKWISPRSE